MDELGLRTWRMARKLRRVSPSGKDVLWELLESDWRERLATNNKSQPILVNPPQMAEQLGLDAKTVRAALEELDAPHTVDGRTIGIDVIRQAEKDKCPRTVWVFHSVTEADASPPPPDPQKRMPFARESSGVLDTEADAGVDFNGSLRHGHTAGGDLRNGQQAGCELRDGGNAGRDGSGPSDHWSEPREGGSSDLDGPPSSTTREIFPRENFPQCGNFSRAGIFPAASAAVVEISCSNTSAQARTGSFRRKEPVLEEQENNTSTTSDSLARKAAGKFPVGVETGGKISRQTAQGIISRLRQARPPELPWTQITHLAEMGAAGVQHPQAEALEHLSRRLVLTAAIVATLEPEQLGEAWVQHAASIASTASKSRRGLFFKELARGLRGLSDQAEDHLNDMQSFAARLIAWFDGNGGKERFRGRKPRPKAPAPPPPPSEPADPEAVKAFKERLARHQAAKNHQPQGGTK